MYSDDDIKYLNDREVCLDEKLLELGTKIHFLNKKLNNDAYEFAIFGFMRRLSLLRHCINNVYNLHPPDLNLRLNINQTHDLTLFIQCFYVNLYGCLDNLAWIYVKNNNISLNPREVSLYKIQNKLSIEFQKLYSDYNTWIEYVKFYRDSLSHRIPLYIPPANLNDDEINDFYTLEQKISESIKDLNYTDFEKYSKQRDSLGSSSFFIAPSLKEDNWVIFHAQIINDWDTLIDITEKFIIYELS